MKFNLEKSENILIVGAGHGIGFSLVFECLNRNKKAKVLCTYRNEKKASELIKLKESYGDRLFCYQLDPCNETSVDVFFKKLKDAGVKIDLLINSVGFLHDEHIKPEKSLKDFNVNKLMSLFLVNSAVTGLLAKNFEYVRNEEGLSCFVSLSAKVGSIEDNKMGGWYAYRASKAALNMILKNISIEFKRKRYNCLVLSIHPGTTETELSKPYITNTNYKLHLPIETAQNILNVIQGREVEDSGAFLSWDGAHLPW